MKLILLMAVILVSCGKNKSGSDNKYRSISQLAIDQSVYVRCSQDSFALRCSRIVADRLMHRTEFFSPVCHRDYVNCLNRGF